MKKKNVRKKLKYILNQMIPFSTDMPICHNVINLQKLSKKFDNDLIKNTDEIKKKIANEVVENYFMSNEVINALKKRKKNIHKKKEKLENLLIKVKKNKKSFGRNL